MKVLDVYCGMGGWSVGFYREGFQCFGVDIVDVGYPYELTVSDVRDYHPPPKVFDVAVCSPPCTEFSPLTMLSWKKGQRGPPNPEKGLELVKEAIRVIKEAQPTFWLLENVWGSMQHIYPLLKDPRIICKPWVLWGNFAYPSLAAQYPNNTSKKGNRVGLPEDFPLDPLRSWKRARIPVFLSQRIAKACKEEFQSDLQVEVQAGDDRSKTSTHVEP